MSKERCEASTAADSGAHGYPQANMFDQPELEQLMRNNLRIMPTVTLRGNVDVLRVTQGNAAMEDLGFEQRWLVIDIDTSAPLNQWEGVHQLCDSHRAGTYMRVGEVRYRWEFRLLPDETAADFATMDTLHPLIRPWTGDVPVDDLRVIRVADYTFHAQVANKWRDRRVFLLGDAAHLSPPFIGQGMGLPARSWAAIPPGFRAQLSALARTSAVGRLCPNAPTSVSPDAKRFDDIAGNGFALLALAITPEEPERILHKGAAPVVPDPGSELHQWLVRHRVTAAVVRPDRTVMLTSDSVSGSLTRLPSFHSATAYAE